MEFKLALLAVKDVEVSKKFYQELFDQEVILDLGKNVTFSGGFAIQENFACLTDLPDDSVMQKSHNMELYFEVESFNIQWILLRCAKVIDGGVLWLQNYHVMVRGNNRESIFVTDEQKRFFRDCLKKQEEPSPLLPAAFCK